MENDNAPQRPANEREWKLIEKLLGQAQDEHRKSRRWGIFFKALTFVYLFAVLVMVLPGKTGNTMVVAEEHVAIVEVKRGIPDNHRPFRRNCQLVQQLQHHMGLRFRAAFIGTA